MKTKILTLAFILFNIVSNAQNNNFTSFSDTTLKVAGYENQLLRTSYYKKLCPVYFNYRKRLLKYNGTNRMNEAEFLNLCRSIKDSLVQQQVARYDAFTKDKEKLGLIALGGGFTAIGTLGTAAGVAGQGNDMITGSLVFFGVVGMLMIPIAAIYSTVPHQKRKAVLFRDLPVAYNQYVETQNSK